MRCGIEKDNRKTNKLSNFFWFKNKLTRNGTMKITAPKLHKVAKLKNMPANAIFLGFNLLSKIFDFYSSSV